jgi:hypothetical protein
MSVLCPQKGRPVRAALAGSESLSAPVQEFRNAVVVPVRRIPLIVLGLKLLAEFADPLAALPGVNAGLVVRAGIALLAM